MTLSCEAIWQWRRRLLKSGAAFLEVLAVFEKVRIRRIGNWIRLSRILEMKKKSELTWLLLDAMLWGPCLVCQWACHRGWNCVPWRCTSQIPCQITDKFNYKIRTLKLKTSSKFSDFRWSSCYSSTDASAIHHATGTATGATRATLETPSGTAARHGAGATWSASGGASQAPWIHNFS